MRDQLVRVRFAPAPTGAMHLGNVRAALICYMFAKQHNGSFILRIEDTDMQRNVDPKGKKIIEDMYWLGLLYDEGPDIGGAYGPYLQSQRIGIYNEYLTILVQSNAVYQCFCTPEILEKKRLRAIALKQPPRYDKQCLSLSEHDRTQLLDKKSPFIWRFHLPDEIIMIHDLARGNMEFNLQNFSDFPITRQDGSYTFVFANFIDDMTMKISHIFRGEEHLSNTAVQAALYKVFQSPLPVFWHLPIICNVDGKKLSKRDFGFSLNDLMRAGYIPEALLNYLALIGGGIYEKEIISLSELVHAVNFEKSASAGFIKYDPEKLRWINHQWVRLLSIEKLVAWCRPFLEQEYVTTKSISDATLGHLLQLIRDNIVVAVDAVHLLKFFFELPVYQKNFFDMEEYVNFKIIFTTTLKNFRSPVNPQDLLNSMVLLCKDYNLKLQYLYKIIRIAFTGNSEGIAIKDLFNMLSYEEIIKRFTALLYS